MGRRRRASWASGRGSNTAARLRSGVNVNSIRARLLALLRHRYSSAHDYTHKDTYAYARAHTRARMHMHTHTA
eukprot:5898944-Pleurochrysis_carterae.AAC.1